MDIQDAKDKIDGYHALVFEGIELMDDATDSIMSFIAGIAKTEPSVVDDLHDYVFESAKKFNLL